MTSFGFQPLRLHMRTCFRIRCCRFILGALIGALLGACSNETPPDSNCPLAHPSFRLTVDADGQQLPHDVRITVRYGGTGTEDFIAAHPNQSPKIVFCDAQGPEAGPADASDDHAAGSGDGYDQIVCDLWTDGAATVEIRASGYPMTTRDLSANTDACGLVLTNAHITLEKSD